MPIYGAIVEFLQATIALIAIANPFAAGLPVARRHQQPDGQANRVVMAVAVVAAVVWLVLSGFLHRRIGLRGEAIVVRFMGLVLVAIGAQLVLAGIGDFFGATSDRRAG